MATSQDETFEYDFLEEKPNESSLGVQHQQVQKETLQEEEGGNGLSSEPVQQPSAIEAPGNTTAIPAQHETVEAEYDTKILEEWRAKFDEEVQRKDEDSKAKRQEMRAKAEEELEEYYAKKTNTNANRFSNNRELEKEFLKEIQETIDTSEGNPWERIVSLVDLQAEYDGTDLTRMKNLLLQLKSSSPGFLTEAK